MTTADNIKRLREIFSVTQKELAAVAGVTENAVSKWENGYAEPRMGAIERMAACYGLSKSHIIEDGGMDFVDPVTKRPSRPVGSMLPKTEARKAYVSLLGRVHAGEAQEPEIIDGAVPVPFEVLDHHKRAYFLQVEGSCMNKVYPEGCYVLIDPDMEPRDGSIAVVSIDGADYVMRRMHKGANSMILSPESFDESFQDIIIVSGDGHVVELKGTVVWYQPEHELE